jgi:uncharacterized FlgJ-related protein
MKKKELFHYDSENLVFRKTNRLLKYRIIVAVLFLSVSLLSFVAVKKPQKEYIHTEIVINKEHNQSKLFERIDELPFKYPEIVKAQMLIETGNFKSAVFKANNNAFGMRLAKQRLTLATGDNLKHAVYKNVEESIIDRLIYEAKYMNNLSKEEYYSFLDKLYAEGDNYSKTLKQIIKKNKLDE